MCPSARSSWCSTICAMIPRPVGQTQEILLGSDYGHKVVRIPPGVAHGCKVIGDVTHLFYVTSNVYNPEDEGRIPHDDPDIGYDWTAGPPIK